MGFFINFLFLLTAFMACGTLFSVKAAAFEQSTVRSCPQHILYLIHTQRHEAALSLYEDYFEKNKTHDTEFLEQLGLCLLEQGSNNPDPEIQLMAILGAGIGMNEKTLHILARGIESRHPHLQLVALNFLGRWQNDEADRLLVEAMRSNFLPIQFEAAHLIAMKSHPKATNYIESLMGKVDVELRPLFSQLFALINDADSVRMLKKLLADPNEAVRSEAILCSAKTGRDDLLPKIRILVSHPSLSQQEACAIAFGELKDEYAIPALHFLSQSEDSATRLAALQALYNMGDLAALKRIESLALQGDLFAISILGDTPETKATLKRLIQSDQFLIKMNAALALLKLQDPSSVPVLKQLLIKDSRDLAFTSVSSRGNGFSYWKAVPSARQNFEDSAIELEISLHFREKILSSAIDLPEDNFLELVKAVLDAGQNDLVPTAIELLETLQTKKAIAILKSYQQQPAAPLIRNYCNLALYRLKEEGPYDENLRIWVRAQSKKDLIQLRPFVPWEKLDDPTTYQISAHETSRLLIESFEAFASRQDDKGISAILDAIKNGNPKNKYALSGLLIRASL